MKKLMYLSISILCLSIAALIGFNIGSQAVQAQAPEPISAYKAIVSDSYEYHFVMLSNGDVYKRRDSFSATHFPETPPMYMGNYWTGSSVSTNQTNWGQIKGEYKGK
jgi:hypothetical protein